MATTNDDLRQTALAYYSAARSEVVQRLALREQVVLASITASGVLGGIAFRAGVNYDPLVLLLIPLLVGPFTIAFARHDWIIRHIGNYLAKELRPALRKLSADLPDWDASQVLHNERQRFLTYEKLIFALLLCGPAFIVLWLSRSEIHVHRLTYAISGLETIGVAVFFIRDIVRIRRTL